MDYQPIEEMKKYKEILYNLSEGIDTINLMHMSIVILAWIYWNQRFIQKYKRRLGYRSFMKKIMVMRGQIRVLRFSRNNYIKSILKYNLSIKIFLIEKSTIYKKYKISTTIVNLLCKKYNIRINKTSKIYLIIMKT